MQFKVYISRSHRPILVIFTDSVLWELNTWVPFNPAKHLMNFPPEPISWVLHWSHIQVFSTARAGATSNYFHENLNKKVGGEGEGRGEINDIKVNLLTKIEDIIYYSMFGS